MKREPEGDPVVKVELGVKREIDGTPRTPKTQRQTSLTSLFGFSSPPPSTTASLVETSPAPSSFQSPKQLKTFCQNLEIERVSRVMDKKVVKSCCCGLLLLWPAATCCPFPSPFPHDNKLGG